MRRARFRARGVLALVLLGALAACAAAPPPEPPEPPASSGPVLLQRGTASWYGPGFHGRRTASGERYDQNAMTAAHRTLPMGTTVTVRNLENGRTVRVRINDRGPYKRGRVIDLSRAAARSLDIVEDGLAPVAIEVAPEGEGGPPRPQTAQVPARMPAAAPDAGPGS